MGVVWLAHDGALERDVALKFLPEIIAKDPAAIKDMKRETRRALENPLSPLSDPFNGALKRPNSKANS